MKPAIDYIPGSDELVTLVINGVEKIKYNGNMLAGGTGLLALGLLAILTPSCAVIDQARKKYGEIMSPDATN